MPEPHISYDGTPYYGYEEEDDEHPGVLNLECVADLAVEDSARVEGEGLSKPSLEGVYRA